ncbi:Nitrilase 3 [Galdieria sulphuraria]|uniref:Nitrilase n=1 Tax=Galdieria sulphuraria TaxID=130081 RepID=M2XVT9_GALSU|nr:nitrilase [Galdieria sulphuraria]EME27539.1 nitrilase [Galdieria sulphuraria]GJD09739.1 Nitrilase 3 [Galdieria sulphuraria]|eukprot:XP_005704059.1 nitrilase [Galdieria sulphuraria]
MTAYGSWNFPNVTVAAAHVSSVYFDVEKSLEKLEAYAIQAARQGAALIAFGESFLPGFPVWNLVLSPLDQHELFKKLYETSVEVPSDITEKIARIARENRIHISVGITERSKHSLGTLWNSNLIFDDKGILKRKHRKLVPTFAEKLTWSNGDGSGLEVLATNQLGRVGALICGENTNTLARFSLIAQGEQIHISTYPPCWPITRKSSTNYSLDEAIRIRAAAHAFEGKLFNIVACCCKDQSLIDIVSEYDTSARNVLEFSSPSISMIVGPQGEIIGEPLSKEEGLVVAEINLSQGIFWKKIHDITGGYNRFDVFHLSVNFSSEEPIDDSQRKVHLSTSQSNSNHSTEIEDQVEKDVRSHMPLV